MGLKPIASKPDWFRAPRDELRSVWGVPGARLNNLDLDIHRSMLPLLESRPDLGPITTTDHWAQRDLETEPKGFKLRVTQQQAIDFIIQRRGTLLGDDMRLGKTLSAIMSHNPELGQLVIIAPLSTRATWLGWLRRVFPDQEIGVITGHKFDRDKVTKPIVFGHYDVISHWQVVQDIGTIVFDEAHALTNRTAGRTKAAVLLASRAKRVVAMTGTPMWNLPTNLWSVVNLIAPGAWGAYHEFSQRYGAPMSTAYGPVYTGVSNESELRLRLSEVMLRRRWVDACDDVPAINRSVVVADISDQERRKLDILAGQIKSERTNTVGNLSAYRRQVTSLKLVPVIQEINKITDRNEPVVVWTWHKDYAEDIARRASGSFLIHGEIPSDKREALIEQWRTSSNGVLVATMAVAQVGLDFSHARVAIFAEIDYTPAILGQAEMRTFAPTRPMDIIFVVANHIVDQRIVRALVHKLSAANPLGVGAAIDAIDALRDAVLGPVDHGDLDRLLEDMLGSMQ